MLQRRSPAPKQGEGPQPDVVTPPGPTNFMKGKLTAVDCSDGFGATLTVISSKATWTLHTRNREKMILIGADEFSCDWKNRDVAVNYRVLGSNSGEVISLEIQ